MAHVHLKPDWAIPENRITPEHLFFNRRRFLQGMGFTAAGAAGLIPGLSRAAGGVSFKETYQGLKPLPAKRNEAYRVERPPTPEQIPAAYNNFYEFSLRKNDVWELAARMPTDPWTLEVKGLVGKPRTFDVGELLRTMPLEERVYRFRCVEAWSMVVPWIGFPLKALLDKVEPNSAAKYIRFATFNDPKIGPRQGESGFFGSREPWPYTEGLSMAEATNELTLLTVGSYGHVLPKQHGAPIRLIVPWKYGFKNIKSIVSMELMAERPPTFWNTIAANEYGFVSNVNPRVPHPRWSQATERDIGTQNRQPTLYLNGYEAQVGGLYRS